MAGAGKSTIANTVTRGYFEQGQLAVSFFFSKGYIVFIDALDECEGESDTRIILRLLAEARSPKKVWLRVLITSRPEVPIRSGFLPDI
jgi:hypothetical protein